MPAQSALWSDGAAWRRALECVLLFGGVPLALLWFVPRAWWPWLLAIAAALCVTSWLRRGPSLRRCWVQPLRAAEREWLPFLVARLGACSLMLIALVFHFAPERLFDLPRQDTALWLLILASYPLCSALPQEVVYRYLFRYRYRRLFRGAWVWPSAVAFAWLHVAFANVLAPLLCLVGGWFFARTYHLSRSLRLAVAEHALYGSLVFSVGLGDFFFHAGPNAF